MTRCLPGGTQTVMTRRPRRDRPGVLWHDRRRPWWWHSDGRAPQRALRRRVAHVRGAALLGDGARRDTSPPDGPRPLPDGGTCAPETKSRRIRPPAVRRGYIDGTSTKNSPRLRWGDGRGRTQAAAGCSTGGGRGRARWGCSTDQVRLVVCDIYADAITGGVVAGEYGAGHRCSRSPAG